MEFPLKIECNVNKNFTFKENIFVFFIYVCASCFDFFPLGQKFVWAIAFCHFFVRRKYFVKYIESFPKTS